MSKGMPWVHLYTEMLDDPKIGRLPDALKWRYTSLILVAGECDRAGELIDGMSPLTVGDLAWRLRCESEPLAENVRELVAAGLLHWDGATLVVTAFQARNPMGQEERREQWNRSQQKRRASPPAESPECQQPVNADTTESQQDVNVLDKSRVEESRGEEQEHATPPADAGATLPPKPRKRNGKPPDPDTQERRALFAALARVCGLDQNLKRGQLNAVTKLLGENGYTAAQVLTFPPWWGINDWRGKKGQRPTLGQVVELLPQAIGTAAEGSTATIDWSKYESGEYAHLFAED